MAKVAFSKLNKVKSLPSIKCDFEGIDIEVEQYLPLEKKVQLMANVIECAGNGEEGFFNIVKLDAYYKIDMLQAYTNISFTEKQLEDVTKLFDAIELNGIWAFVCDKIPHTEKEYIWNNILNLAKEITAYNNSILGVLKTVNMQGSDLSTKIQEIAKEYDNPELIKLANLIGQAE